MSVPKSFINYMKTMRNYYRLGAPYTDPLPIDFNFDDMEIDAHSYGFTCNNHANDINHNAINAKADSATNRSNISRSVSDNLSDSSTPRDTNHTYTADSIRSEELTVAVTANSPTNTPVNSPAKQQENTDNFPFEPEEPAEVMATEVKVIRLFDQGEILVSLDSTTQEQEQQKRPLTLIEKISAAFSKLFS